jgi:hypothetical protein
MMEAANTPEMSEKFYLALRRISPDRNAVCRGFHYYFNLKSNKETKHLF